MEIIQKLVSKDKFNIKCPYSMSPFGITVHNTANSASAANEIAYMTGNDKEVSYHFAVDETEIIQALPLDRNGWHAGDGATGSGNRRTIAIEICRSTSEDINLFLKAEKNAAWLCASLCLQNGWTSNNIYTHQHWSGKNCPHKTLELGWDRFLAMVDKEMIAMSQQEKKGDFVKMTDLQKELFVKNVLYIGLLDRQADDGGIRYWVGRMTDDVSVSEITDEFMKSEEYRKRTIEVAYERLLQREPDPEGLAYWMEQLLKTGSADVLYKSIKGTEEYKKKKGQR